MTGLRVLRKTVLGAGLEDGVRRGPQKQPFLFWKATPAKIKRGESIIFKKAEVPCPFQ